MARAAGATVFAVVLTDRSLAVALGERIAARLGRAGADKVLLCEGDGLTAPPLDATHGSALYAAVERVPPLLVLFPAGGAGYELGPGLAARLGGAFAANVDLEVGESAVPLADGVGRVFLRRWRRDHAHYRRFDPVELERPVVAVLPAGGTPDDLGTEAVELEVIACRTPIKVGVAELASEPDDKAPIALASVLVIVDPSLGPEPLAVLRAGAPPEVVVVDPSTAPDAIAASAPRIVVGVGAPVAAPLGTGVTPRGRVGLVLPAGTPVPPGTTVDVLWSVPPDAGKPFWTELAASLSALAAPRAKTGPGAGGGARAGARAVTRGGAGE